MKFKFLLYLLVFFVVGFVAQDVLRRYYRFDWDQNKFVKLQSSSLIVSHSNDFDVQGIEIFFTSSRNKSMAVYSNGKRTKNELLLFYGPEEFRVYHHKELIGTCGLHKTNWWQHFTYQFYFEGVDSVSFNFSVLPEDNFSGYYLNHINK